MSVDSFEGNTALAPTVPEISNPVETDLSNPYGTYITLSAVNDHADWLGTISDDYSDEFGGSWVFNGTILPDDFTPMSLNSAGTLSGSSDSTTVIYQDGTTTNVYPESVPDFGAGPLNAALGTGAEAGQPATQMLAGGPNHPPPTAGWMSNSTLVEMDPSTGEFNPPLNVMDLSGVGSGFTGFVGKWISDYGAIVGTATYTPTGTTDPIAAGPHGVLILPVIFTVTRPNAPASEVAANPSVTTTPTNTIPRDEIVNVKLKIPPLANQDLTVTLDVTPDAMKTQTLATPNDSCCLLSLGCEFSK